jgi:ChpA-C
MNSWARKSIKAGALSAGFLLAGATAAHASDLTTSNNAGIGNGTQVLTPIQIPIDLCGNAIGVLGGATAGCVGGSHARLDAESLPEAWTELNFGIGNGTQLMPLVQIPIDVCGNSVAVLGGASASCLGGSAAVIGGRTGTGPDYVKPVTKPAAKPAKHHKHGKKHVKGGKAEGYGSGYGGGSCADLTSTMNAGLLNGTQALVPVQAPIDISGNAMAVGGSAFASSIGGATTTLTC